MANFVGMCETLSSNSMLTNNQLQTMNKLFLENNWRRIVNEEHLITYSKKGHETDYVELKIQNQFICVTIPIKNIPFVYKTKFTDLVKAIEYAEIRFKHFISPALH